MKKLLLLFLCLTLLLLSSCSKLPPSKEKENIDDISSGASESSNTQHVQSVQNDSGEGDRYTGFHLETYEEYTQYMATHDIPEHFIPYEDLTAFGEFDSCFFNFGDDLLIPPYQLYTYSFVSGGQKWTLTIDHQTETYYGYEPDMNKLSTYDPQDSDMRYYPGIGNLYCKYENIRFYYSNDKLTDVHWVSHDVGFWLMGTPHLYEYQGGNIPINMLLNKESVADFKAMFDDHVAPKKAVK